MPNYDDAEISLYTWGSLVRYFTTVSLVPLVCGCHSVLVAPVGSFLVFPFVRTLLFLDCPSVALAGPVSRTAVGYHTIGRLVGHDYLGIVAFYPSRLLEPSPGVYSVLPTDCTRSWPCCVL